MASNVGKKASNLAVWIIILLLIVGLAGFGVGNFGTTLRAVGSVGQTEVDVETYGRTLQQRLSEIQQQTGSPLTFAEAQQLGLSTAVLQQLLSAAALDEAARTAGLSVGDEAVSEQILTIPGFQDANGAFDRTAYEFALDRTGLTVEQFENQIRRELSRGLLQAALVGGVTPPPAYADAIHGYLGEARSFSHSELTAADLESEPEPPTDDDVTAYYEANPEAFTRPEARRISYAILTPDMLLDSVELDETALRALYDERQEEFQRPERRMVDRLVFPDQATADAARTRLDAGEVSFEDLVAERGLEIEDVDIGVVNQADLGDAGEAVFAPQDNGVVGPVESQFGPALIRVNAILAAQNTPFEEARTTLREELASDRARRVIEAEVEPLNDLLAGGATLEELAADSDMTFGTIDLTGTETDGPAAYDGFRAAAFEVAEDDYPEIALLEDGGIFALRLDEVVPPTLQPLEAVEEDARAGAEIDLIRQALVAEAETMEAELGAGGSLSDLGVSVTQDSGITRQSFLQTVPAALLTEVFELEPGEVSIVEDGASVWLVQLDAVEAADPADPLRAQIQAQLDQQIAPQMAEDILTAFSRAVQQQEGISINQNALNAVHGQIAQ